MFVCGFGVHWHIIKSNFFEAEALKKCLALLHCCQEDISARNVVQQLVHYGSSDALAPASHEIGLETAPIPLPVWSDLPGRKRMRWPFFAKHLHLIG